MNICIIGAGYVGLVTGACFAEFGLNVTCVDKYKEKIALLSTGQIPIYEPGLDGLVNKNLRAKRLSFTANLEGGVKNALVIFIAVGTPSAEDGHADLTYIREVAKAIGKTMDGYKVIVTKSTVPVGTGKLIEEIILKNQNQKCPFDVVSNPEFLREGSAIEDFMRPNRVVIGTNSEQAIAILKDLYRPLYLIETPFVITDVKTAEMIKYASNTFLATKVSFINEMANICEKVGADVHKVARGMGLDNRIGSKFLHPGPGFGGACFPKDTKAILQIAKEVGYDFKIARAVITVNKLQSKRMVAKIKEAVGNLRGKKIGILGLTFKPNTDDIREAPAIEIVKRLQREGAKIRVFDPEGMENARKILRGVEFANSSYEVPKGAHGLVIITEWNQFRNLDWKRIKPLLKSPIVIDLKNIYEPEKMRAMGFQYTCVGR